MFKSKYQLIIIGMLLLLLIFCSGCHPMEHNFYADYYKDMGRPTHFLTYSEAIKYYGEPISTEETQNNSAIFLELKYKDLVLYLEKIKGSTIHNDFYEHGIKVLSDKYEFGPAKIKVGSTRIQVNEAYKNLEMIDDGFLEQTYDDSTTAVTFTYNIIGIVTSISIYPISLAI